MLMKLGMATLPETVFDMSDYDKAKRRIWYASNRGKRQFRYLDTNLRIHLRIEVQKAANKGHS